jgi:hypothetical protein
MVDKNAQTVSFYAHNQASIMALFQKTPVYAISEMPVNKAKTPFSLHVHVVFEILNINYYLHYIRIMLASLK